MIQSEARTKRDMPDHRLPGELGVWMFVLGDLAVFGLFFATYLYYRGDDIDLFDRSQARLDVGLGVVNTLLLLTSSWFVAAAVKVLRREDRSLAQRLLVGAIGGGLAFVAVKSVEYHDKLAHGLTLVTNDFFMYYFMYTGIHLIHVLVGLGLLILLWRKAARATADDMPTYESGAIFWHLVDLLWIMLFPLLYLVSGG